MNTLLDRFEYHADHTPTHTAYTFLNDNGKEESITFNALRKETIRVAETLITIGVPGDRVLILMDSSLEYITAFWGCLYAGMIAVPLYKPKKNDKRARLFSVINDCSPSIAIMYSDTADDIRCHLPEYVHCLPYKLTCFKHKSTVSLTAADKESVAYLQYSSGSTGVPKGVMISHQNLLANVKALECFSRTNSEDVFVSWLPLFHDMGLAGAVFWPLFSGAKSVLLSPMKFIRRPLIWLDTLSRHRGTVSAAPNFAYEYCVSKITTAKVIESLDLRAWRMAFNGAEPVQKKTLDSFSEHFKAAGFSSNAFVSAYGMAEATVFLTASYSESGPTFINVANNKLQQGIVETCAEEANGTSAITGCGVPPEDHEIIIVNVVTLNPVYENCVGEIWSCCESIATGYWNRESINKDVFCAYTCDGQGPYYRTGDLGFFHQQELFISGRLKDLIIASGKNIYPSDVEFKSNQIVNQLGMVHAAAIGISSAGTEEVVLLQEVKKSMPKDSLVKLVNQIQSAVFSAFDVLLSDLVLVPKGTLPRTSSGKIQRRIAKEQYLAGKLEHYYSSHDSENSQADFDEMKSAKPVEKKLASLWESLLGEPVLSPRANFLHLGGNSLLIHRMVSMVRDECGVELDLQALFENPELAAVAASIESLPGIATEVAAPSVENGDNLPLSPQQKHIWLTDQLEDGKAKNNIFFSFRLEGEFDTDLFNNACNKLVARHESLRTRFITDTESDEPRQIIYQHHTFLPSDINLTGLGKAEQKLGLARLIDEESTKTFNLANDCLLRIILIKLEENIHQILFVMHHIITDGWSVMVFVRDLNTLYLSCIGRAENSLPIQTTHYRHYVHRQNSARGQEKIRNDLSYWKQQLKDIPTVHNLFLDYSRKNAQTFQGGEYKQKLDNTVKEKLASICRQQNATLFMGLHSAFVAFLAYYSGEKDIVIGTSSANRHEQNYYDVMGCFFNVLALRTRISSSDSFNTLLTQSKDICLDAFSHQSVSLGDLIEELNPFRHSSYQPIVQILLVLQDYQSASLSLPDVSCSLLEAPTQYLQYDMTLEIFETAEGLEYRWKYNKDIFKQETIKEIAKRYSILLSGMLAAPDKNIFDLSLMSDSEIKQLLQQKPSLTGDLNAQTLMHCQFENTVEKEPDAVAVSCDGESLSYRQLNTKSNQLAHYLIEQGIKPDTLLGLCLDRSPDMVIAILGILKAGGAYVPLDPAYPNARLQFQLDDARFDIVITHNDLLGKAPVSSLQALCLDDNEIVEKLSHLPSTNPELLIPALHMGSLAYVIYTSGSTGEPKGVEISHGGLINYLGHAVQHYFSEVQGAVVSTALSFDATVTSLLAPLAAGKTVHLLNRAGPEAELNALSELMQQSKEPLVFKLTPAHLQALEAGFADKTVSTLAHRLVIGGEQLTRAILRPWLQTFLPEGFFINEYGPTETVVGCSTFTVRGKDRFIDQALNIDAIPIGKPIINTRFYVVNSKLRIVPKRIVGELLIGGAGLARGYLNKPGISLEKFIDNPFSDEPRSRLYCTGDLVRCLEDGNLLYIGRTDEQIKLRGFRIELGEIKSHLYIHPSIREAVVLLDTASTDGQLIAYVTLTGEAGVDVEALREHLKIQLPEFMLPSAFVILETLPLTINGKVDREQLLQIHTDQMTEREYQAPLGKTEIILAGIFSDLLAVDRVSRLDNFYDLGGHSLLLIKLLAQLQSHGFTTDVATIFNAPNLQSLAASLQKQKQQQSAAPANLITNIINYITPDLLPLVELDQAHIDQLVAHIPGGVSNIQDIYPLTPLQEGILFHQISAKQDQTSSYVLSLGFRLSGEQQHNRFLAALDSLISRHDVLRSAVFWQGLPRAVQVVLRKLSLDVGEFILDANRDAHKQIVERIESQKLQIDLRQAPLLQVEMAEDKNTGAYYAIIHGHHIINDHYGLEILVEELTQYINGESLHLESPVAYREFVAHTLSREKDEKAKEYLQSRLADVSEATLPFGLGTDALGSYQIHEARLNVNETLSLKIRSITKSLGVTSASIFHMAWALVVGRCSNRHDVIFGTVMSGRLQGIQGADKSLGLFVNTLPIRLSLKGAVKSCLEFTHNELLTLLEHESISLSMAHSCSNLEGDKPLFSALLDYRHSKTGESGIDSSGLAKSGIELITARERGNYPFDLSIDDFEKAGFAITTQVDASLDPIRIANYVHHALTGIVAALEETPDRLLSEICILSGNERERLLRNFNQSEVLKPASLFIHEHFEAWVKRNSEALAAEHGQQSLSYGELNQGANQLAHYLLQQGIKPGELVGVHLPRSLDFLVAILAIMKAGAAYVMMETSNPQERLQQICDRAELKTIISYRSLSEAFFAESFNLNDAEFKALLTNQDDSNPTISVLPESPAFAYFTSGSTGTPKGALNSHAGVVNNMLALTKELKLSPADRILQFAALGFDVVIEEIFPAWFSGATVVLRDEEGLLDSEQLQALLERNQITVCELMASYWSHWVCYLKQQNQCPPASLRIVMLGSDRVMMEAYRQWQDFGIPILNVFGLTEAGCTSLVYHATGSQPYENYLPNGQPLSNTEIYVLDDSRQPVPENVTGELYIGGIGVGLGYVGEPELTTQSFMNNPFGEGRLYKTGDAVRWMSDGNLEFIGRQDRQVKIRGFRIELDEVENQLRQDASIENAAVILHKVTTGEGRLVAWVTATNGAVVIDDVGKNLAKRLPEHMQPSLISVLEELPLTLTGKINYRALPEPELSNLSSAYQAPQNETEKLLVEIWQEVLGLEKVGRQDNFFALGGHSLLAVRLVSMLEYRLGRQLNLETVFKKPCLYQQAYALSSASFISQEPIIMADREQLLPLSWSQQRLWFMEKLEGDSSAYHILGALRLTGDLLIEALDCTFQTIVERHEVLRTVFEETEGKVEQIILPQQYFKLTPLNLTQLDVSAQEKAIEEAIAWQSEKVFDLNSGPMIRGQLLKLSVDQHVLLIAMHHIVFDATSMDVLVDEFNQLYHAYSTGQENPLAPLSLQYADYAVWQRSYLTDEVLAKQETYWQEHLTDIPALLELPTDRPRPALQSYRGDRVKFTIEQALSDQLKALAKSAGLTLYMVLYSAWALLLSKLSGQDQVVIGTPVANRQRHELQGLIGFFVNTLALRADLSGEPTVREFLQNVKALTLEAYAHQEVPFERVVEVIQPERNRSHSPVFQVFLDFDYASENTLALPGLQLEILDTATRVAKFDLTLSLIENKTGIDGRLEYASDLFYPETIERWIDYFKNLLQELVDDQQQSVSRLSFISAEERQALIFTANQTQVKQTSVLVHELFEQQFECEPEALAVKCGEAQLSYAQLNQQANQLAHELIGLGVQTDTLVGVYMKRSLDMVVAILGILKAGGAYVPLEPGLPQARLNYILNDAKLSIVLTQKALQESSPKGLQHTLCLDDTSIKQKLEKLSDTNPKHKLLNNSNLAYVIYTSGSTGKPKGVELMHSSVVNYLHHTQENYFSETAGAVVSTVLSFDATVTSLLGPLAAGKTIHLIEQGEQEAELAALKTLLTDSKEPLVFKITPAHLQALQAGLADTSISFLPHCLVIGGEPLTKSLLSNWKQQYLPNGLFINEYGPTETVVGCSTFTINVSEQLSDAYFPGTAIPIGQPIRNTQFFIVDKSLNIVPKGVVGELLIGGVGLARGYLNSKELTAEKFIANPFSNDQDSRLYRSGDLVRYLSDGNLEFIGRVDEQVKLRGFRIELGEIESQISAYPAVNEVAVLLCGKDKDTEGSGQLIAYIGVSDGDNFNLELMRKTLQEQLPEYMLPSQTLVMPSLPLTINGKIDRKALLNLEIKTSGSDYQTPRGETEKILAGIWCDLLKVEQVDRRDNFYDLGGHSLLAIRLIASVQQQLGRQLNISTIFDNPVLNELANQLDAAHFVTQAPITQANRSQILPLSWSQQRLWFIAQLEGANAAYHIPGALRLSGNLSISALQKTFSTIVVRHEVLRTVFKEQDGEARQVINDYYQFEFLQRDLSHLTDEEQRQTLQSESEAEASAAFDLSEGPLLRTGLLRLSDTEHVLLVTMHHIIADGLSMSVLINEVNALYRAYHAGDENPLPPLAIQYADYAVWQQRHFTEQVLGKQENYWQQQLSELPSLLELPTDRARPAVQSYRGDSVPVELGQNLSERVKALAKAEGLTLHMVLYTAWVVVLSRLSGQDQIVVGTPVANRQRQELENLIGFFVNTLALRADLSGEPTVKALLARVKAMTLDGYAHQDVPFERIVEVVQPERSMSFSPIFQVLFNLDQTETNKLELPELLLEEMSLDFSHAQFDLSLLLTDSEAGIKGIVEFATDLFERETIDRWVDYISCILEGFVGQTETSIHALNMLSESECQQLLNDHLKPKANYPEQTLIHQRFEEQVEKNPDALAIVYQDSSLSYRELNQKANQLAHYLIAQGVNPDTLIGLCMERSLEAIIGILAILKAGGAYVALDPAYPIERLIYQIADAKLDLILTQQLLLAHMPFTDHRALCIDDSELQTQLNRESTENPDTVKIGLRPDHLAYVIYTSGSTGQAKGVLVEHRNVCRLFDATDSLYDFSSHDVWTLFHSLAFDFSVWEIWGALFYGGRLIIVPKETSRSTADFYQLVEQEGVTVLNQTPSAFKQFIDIDKSHTQTKSKSKLRYVIFGGEALSLPILQTWVEKYGDDAPQLINMYGITETTVHVTYRRLLHDDIFTPDSASIIGDPLSDLSLMLLTANGQQLVPNGVTGEIYVGGAGLARGYLHRRELSKERFITHPFIVDERLYRSGDLARYNKSGELIYLGRNDQQVKLRGFRIELGEIELQLQSHPTVNEALVILQKTLAGDGKLVAYVTGVKEADLSIEKLRNYLLTSLPEYMIPAAFVFLDKMPLTINGKIDRKALPEPGMDNLLQRDYEEPVGEIEIVLAEVWRVLLSIKIISRQDDFFELGGHSLLIAQLINTIKFRFSVRIPLTVIYAVSNFADMAKLIDTYLYKNSVEAGGSSEEIEMKKGFI